MKAFIRALCVFMLYSLTPYNALRSQPLETNVTTSEKLYLHFDKTYYLPGDTIWFKAYVVDANTHKLSGLSSVLYAELVQSGRKIIKEIKLRLTAGVASGEFVLDNYTEGEAYAVRAFTSSMRNNPGASPFYKVLSVPPSVSVQKSGKMADIQFFPDGGTLISGVRTRIAFKAIDSLGRGVAASGKIIDNSGETIINFQTSHAGMGSFLLTPQNGKSYNAVVSFGNGGEQTKALPAALAKGIYLRADNSNKDSLFVRITNTQNLPNESVNLLAHRGEQVYFSTKAKLDFPVQVAAIPKTRFPEGIIQLSLVKENGEPLNERLVFIRNTVEEKLVVNVSSNNHDSLNKTSLQLQTFKSGVGTFSVSVLDLNKMENIRDDEITIQSHLLLSSDLKGQIENPAHYFNGLSDSINIDLDNLMMSQGYSEYVWKNDIANEGQFYEAETGSTLSGIVSSFGKPQTKVKVQLFSAELNLFTETLSDSNGRFAFDSLDIDSTARVLVKAAGLKNYTILLDTVKSLPLSKSYVSFQPTNIPLVAGELSKKYQERFSELAKVYSDKNAKLLEEVVVTAQKNKPILEHSSNILGPGNADQVVMGEKLRGCINLAQCLIGKLDFVTVQTSGLAMNNRKMANFKGPQFMTIMVDGVPMAGDQMNEINPNDVYSVEVLRTGKNLAIYGSNAPNGAILITMRKGYENDSGPKIAGSGPLNFEYQGFYKARKFYVPQFSSVELSSNTGTVYWNPNVITDSNGLARIDIPTSAGHFRITIEGVDLVGKLYSYTSEFGVR